MKRTFISLALTFLLCVRVFAYDSEVFYKADTDEKMIALTFDDGPHPKYTGEILDVLSEFGVKATFFVIGKNAEAYPETVRREIAEGHEVESHTYSHRFLNRASSPELAYEIEKNSKILDSLGAEVSFIRPPGGLFKNNYKEYIRNSSYQTVLWSVDTGDWRLPSIDRIVSEVINNASPGGVVLMHDYVSGKSSTPAALRIIIPKLQEQGYRFVTVSELFGQS